MTTTLCFWTTGTDMTRMIRDLWDSELVLTAISICTDSGVSDKIAIDICTGKRKLEGDTREGDHTLSVVADSFKTEFTVKKMIERLEDTFIKLTNNTSKLNRTIATSMLPAASKAVYRACKGYDGQTEKQKDQRRLEENEKKLKEVIGGLTLLYPLIGKTISDLPVSKLGKDYASFTQPEENEIIYIQESFEHDKVIREQESKVRRERAFSEKTVTNVKTKKKKPIQIESSSVTGLEFNGWIDPNGRIYNCMPTGHIALANALQDDFRNIIPKDESNPEEYLEKIGWLKLSGGEFYFTHKLDFSALSIDQKKVIKKFFEKTKDSIGFNGFRYSSYEDLEANQRQLYT